MSVLIISDNAVLCRLRTAVISGTVTVNGAPASRDILAYKNDDNNIYASTRSSGADGIWEIEVIGNHNDRFRVICVGDDGENSQIYEHVTVA